MNVTDQMIAKRVPVRIISGHLKGRTGILMGWNLQYDTLRIGFLNQNGEYSGEKTTTHRTDVATADRVNTYFDPSTDTLKENTMSDMKTWVTTETGKVYHSFGVVHAECRKSIKPGTGRPMISESRVDEILAKPWGVSTQGYRKCEKCAQLEADFRSRAEASMQPSTGEGDYLPPAAQIETPQTPSKEQNMNVTTEVIQALALIRSQPGSTSEEALANVLGAIDILDNAGVFAAIDEATGYDVDPEPQRTSKCTCPRTYGGQFLRMGHRTGCSGDPATATVSRCTCPPSYAANDHHSAGCPGDPAEWGDLAYTDGR